MNNDLSTSEKRSRICIPSRNAWRLSCALCNATFAVPRTILLRYSRMQTYAIRKEANCLLWTPRADLIRSRKNSACPLLREPSREFALNITRYFDQSVLLIAYLERVSNCKICNELRSNNKLRSICKIQLSTCTYCISTYFLWHCSYIFAKKTRVSDERVSNYYVPIPRSNIRFSWLFHFIETVKFIFVKQHFSHRRSIRLLSRVYQPPRAIRKRRVLHLSLSLHRHTSACKSAARTEGVGEGGWQKGHSR